MDGRQPSTIEPHGQSALVARATAGDARAFSRLVETHWDRLVRLARSVVGEADAEDVVQDGLIRAWRKLPGLRTPDAFPAWVARVVLRRCFHQARHRRLRLVPLEGAPEPQQRAGVDASLDVERLLAALAPRQRAVMHLTVVEGWTDSEIAVLLDITPASVRSHRRRAREALAERLGAGAPSHRTHRPDPPEEARDDAGTDDPVEREVIP